MREERHQRLKRQEGLIGAQPFSQQRGESDASTSARATTTTTGRDSATRSTRTSQLASSSTTSLDDTIHSVSSVESTAASTSSPASSGTTRSAIKTSSLASTESTTATRTAVEPNTSSAVQPSGTELIFPTTFASDFPRPTYTRAIANDLAQHHLFSNNEVADSMLIFISFVVAFLALTFITIPLCKSWDRRRGNRLEDQMIGEGLRWGEGGDVLEKRLVHVPIEDEGRSGSGRIGDGRPVRQGEREDGGRGDGRTGHVGPSKLRLE